MIKLNGERTLKLSFNLMDFVVISCGWTENDDDDERNGARRRRQTRRRRRRRRRVRH